MDKQNKKAVIVLSNVSRYNSNFFRISELSISLLGNLSGVLE